MPEDTDTKDKFRIKTKEFIDFLEEKTHDSNCTACGGESWTVLCQDGDNNDAYRFNLDIKNVQTPRSAPVYAVACSSCGLVRLHMAGVVQKWIRDRKKDDILKEERNGDE